MLPVGRGSRPFPCCCGVGTTQAYIQAPQWTRRRPAAGGVQLGSGRWGPSEGPCRVWSWVCPAACLGSGCYQEHTWPALSPGGSQNPLLRVPRPTGATGEATAATHAGDVSADLPVLGSPGRGNISVGSSYLPCRSHAAWRPVAGLRGGPWLPSSVTRLPCGWLVLLPAQARGAACCLG